MRCKWHWGVFGNQTPFQRTSYCCYQKRLRVLLKVRKNAFGTLLAPFQKRISSKKRPGVLSNAQENAKGRFLRLGENASGDTFVGH
jgi:hypothetical protein